MTTKLAPNQTDGPGSLVFDDGVNAPYGVSTGPRGVVVQSETANTSAAIQAIPKGTPAGTNKAYSNMRAWDVDINADATGSRRAIGQETHFDTDSTMRVRHSTRSEGTPSIKHPDYYWQINGNNCMYVGTALGGLGLSAVNMGFFPQPMAFKTTYAPLDVAATTVYWTADTVTAVGDEVAVSDVDFVYLECTARAGDFKTHASTEPTPGAIGTTVVDDQVTWTVRSRLVNAAESAEAVPTMWMAESGDTGFGTMQPAEAFHFADTTLFSKGVKFPATQVTSADVNTLDDYEEGDFTPVLSDGTNDVSAGNTSVKVGKYTKIGRQVSISGRIVTTALDSVSGSIRIDGLPFTSNGVSDAHTAITTGLASGLAITAGQAVTGYIAASTDYITLTLWDATTGTTAMQETEWTVDGGLVFSATYFV